MPKRIFIVLICGFALLGRTYAQQVIVPTDTSTAVVAVESKKEEPMRQAQVAKEQPIQESLPKAKPVMEQKKEQPIRQVQVAKAQPVQESLPKGQPIIGQIWKALAGLPPVTEQRTSAPPVKIEPVKAQPAVAQSVKVQPPKPQVVKAEAAVPRASNDSTLAKPQSVKAAAATTPATKPAPAIPPSLIATARKMRLTKVEPPPPEPSSQLPLKMREENQRSMETAFTKLADGFDFPVGKPDAQGYYKARGFRSRGHLGEDWDGIKGGDTDLGSPIYSIGDGIVVFARDCHMGWGNVIIVRHTYRENGVMKNIDALYGHLNRMLVHRGQAIARGQQIATMGTAHGLYDAHLHLEIRKNIEIGMSRAAFARDFTNYYDPSQFIASHRHLPTGGGTYRVAMNTFVRDARINFDKARNYSKSRSRRGSSESATALKKALTAKN